MKNYVKTLTDLLFNSLMGLILGIVLLLPFGYNPALGALVAVLYTLVSFAITFYTGKSIMPKFLLYAGLFKEIWISRVMELFYPTAAWLKRSQDFSGLVTYNTINLAMVGADPTVLVNNTSYPVPYASRTDVPLALPLDYYDTEGTVVENAEAVQLAYPKMDTVISQHGKALAKAQSAKAAWNYAPQANGAQTPVLTCMGNAKVAYAANSRLPFSFRNIIAAGQAFDAIDAPTDGRVLVLNPKHKQDLLNEDVNLFKGFVDTKTGMIGQLYGFDIYVSTQCPTYNNTVATAPTKNAWQAAPAGTDVISSFFFIDTEVMRAQGTMDMFYRLRDPEARGDIVGFQQRFVALSIRNYCQGAICDYTSAAAVPAQA